MPATEAPGGEPPPLSTPAGALWMFVTGSRGNRNLSHRQIDEAEHSYHRILAALLSQDSTPQLRYHLATAYHQLGMVAQLRGQLEGAEERYRKSLSIRDELGGQLGSVRANRQPGMVAQSKARLRRDGRMVSKLASN